MGQPQPHSLTHSARPGHPLCTPSPATHREQTPCYLQPLLQSKSGVRACDTLQSLDVRVSTKAMLRRHCLLESQSYWAVMTSWGQGSDKKWQAVTQDFRLGRHLQSGGRQERCEKHMDHQSQPWLPPFLHWPRLSLWTL
jgi:hypothetical protein